MGPERTEKQGSGEAEMDVPVDSIPFGDGGVAFVEAVKVRGRELAAQRDPISYFTALHESIARLLAGGYQVGQEPFIDELCRMSVAMREGGGNMTLAMLVETVTVPGIDDTSAAC